MGFYLERGVFLVASEPFTLSGEPDAYDMAVEAPGKAVQQPLFPPHLLPADLQKPAQDRYFRPSLVDWIDDGGWR